MISENLASPDEAIMYLKKQIQSKKSVNNFDYQDELEKTIKFLRKENRNLLLLKNELKRNLIYIQDSFNEKRKKFFDPPVSHLKRSKDYTSFICSCCCLEKKPSQRVRILSNKRNFVICKQCKCFVFQKYKVEMWKINN